MPLGFERFNERSQRPNAQINFIKPLASSTPADQAIAKDFLERIAAQCYPVMKRDYISVMSLEEYPPNPEFLGRNFNAGEVIQLVLKDKSGRWLSFNFVQMVMMHELAHCKQMNHSRFFWQVRNGYADQMKELWAKTYTGEGLWGRGQSLTTGRFVHDRMPADADIPEHLCGGSYRRARGRKRKRGSTRSDKPNLTYAERQQKRIARKFGIHGEGKDLGENDLVRGALETMSGGKRQYGKPKVANSKRGRELRANAALARFQAAKNEQETYGLGEGEDSETDWSGDDEEDFKNSSRVGFDGKRIKDEHGNDLVRVCGDDNERGEDLKSEMDDLLLMGTSPPEMAGKARSQTATNQKDPSTQQLTAGATLNSDSVAPAPSNSKRSGTAPGSSERNRSKLSGPSTDSETESEYDTSEISVFADSAPSYRATKASAKQPTSLCEDHQEEIPQVDANVAAQPSMPLATTCEICSLENEPSSPTCIACAHVLRPSLVANHWRCSSKACEGSLYVNAGDAGRCGLCGSQRLATREDDNSSADRTRAPGVVGPDLLRWE